jgi:2-amino-4-hydroxy-6-hydroxymethyldihydropteridine diphosphokinase
VNLYLSLGSNLGDRKENIRKAIEYLDEAFGVHYSALSEIIETEPWGFDSANGFLNCCVLYSLPKKMDGEAVLGICKETERSLGREGTVEFDGGGKRIYRDRTIDIDILFLGRERINSETLTVPHPLMRQREFVMVPLREIARPSLRRAFPEIFS